MDEHDVTTRTRPQERPPYLLRAMPGRVPRRIPFRPSCATLTPMNLIGRIDGAHRLDAASVACLTLVAHRLHRKPVGLIFGADGALLPSLRRFPTIGLGRALSSRGVLAHGLEYA